MRLYMVPPNIGACAFNTGAFGCILQSIYSLNLLPVFFACFSMFAVKGQVEKDDLWLVYLDAFPLHIRTPDLLECGVFRWWKPLLRRLPLRLFRPDSYLYFSVFRVGHWCKPLLYLDLHQNLFRKHSHRHYYPSMSHRQLTLNN